MIRWGLLSPARIGEVVLAGAAAHARSGAFVAVASRDAGRAEAFAARHGLRPFGSYEALLESGAVDAIYVALPNGLHMEWATRALEAGKHVLCEKPLSPRPDEVAAAFAAAERHGRVLAEAFMWRFHDGGWLLGLGCYCVAAARLFTGEPDRVYAEQVTAGEEVDVQMAGTLRCGEVLAQFDCGFNLPRRDRLELIGSEGELHLPDPWVCRQPELMLNGEPLPFGREDGVAQSRALAALLCSAETGAAVEPMAEPATL